MKHARIAGRATRAGQRRLGRWAAPLVLLCGLGLAATASAQHVLKDVSYQVLPGGKVELALKFDGAAVQPRAFTTQQPPRIAMDFADTTNAVAEHYTEIGAGSTAGVSTVEGNGRTRVVVDLFKPASYTTRVSGNQLLVDVANVPSVTSTDAAVVASHDPTRASAIAGTQISNIDFRREDNGGGRVVVHFTGGSLNADMARHGDQVVVDLSGATLPERLAQRLDVQDFATPVTSIETHSQPGGAHMVININGAVETSAYQTGQEYIVEVARKAKKEAKPGINEPPVYSGSRVTFNFQDIPVRSVLQLIADVSNINIVVADSVQGNITLRLINVPWDQALDIVLRAKGLDKRRNGNVIWVAPQAEIAAREKALAEARLDQEQTAELVSDYIPINYGKASEIAKLLTTQSKQGGGGGGGGAGKTRGFLSPRGSVSFDERTNTLLINDTPEKIRAIRDLVGILDKPVQQVLIESRIVIATDNFSRELGVKFGLSGGYEDSNGNVVTTSGSLSEADRMANVALNNRFNGTNGSTVSNPGDIGSGIQVPALNNRLNVNLPSATPAGSFGLAILGADYLLDLELSAAQSEGRGEVISSPKVITANQQEAVIKQGQEIGYVTFQNQGGQAGSGTATVNFKDAVLELKVTPTITADKRVFLQLNVKKDAIAGYTTPPGGGQIPNIDTREITTSVLVDNGQTVVLGGVYEINKQDQLTKVPFLGDIPGLGALFRNTNRSNTKAELLIFVTPRILNESFK